MSIFLIMRPEKPKRVEVNPQQSGLSGLGNALIGLNLGPLPPPPPDKTPDPAEPPRKRRLGRVVLRKETAHRAGRVVIVVDQFPPAISDEALEDLAKGLRQAIGTGGTVKDRRIEMQGDHPGKIRSFLQAAGYDVAGI